MRWLPLGAVLTAVGIVCGAFGAHALKARLEPSALELWETATRYLIYGAFGLMVVGVVGRLTGAALSAPGWSLLGGSLIFSGTVYALALGGPRWLGAVTPIGGALLIAGFVSFAWLAYKLL